MNIKMKSSYVGAVIGLNLLVSIPARGQLLSLTQIAISEGQAFENEPTISFQITRSGPSNFVQTVDYFTTDASAFAVTSAFAGTHYLSRSGTVTFAVNQTSTSIEVPLIDNSRVDGDRYFRIAVTNPIPYAVICPGTDCGEIPGGCNRRGLGTIKDNEHPPTRVDIAFFPEVDRINFRPPGSGLVAEMPNGRILLESMMLQSDGSLDTSFVPGGGTVQGQFSALLVSSDGNILAYYSPPSVNQWRLIRLLSSGAIDPAFNSQPINTLFKAEQADGRLLTSQTTDSSETLFRLNKDGSYDPSFDMGAINPFRIEKVILQPDNKSLIVASFDQGDGTARSGVVRLNSDGALDSTFLRDAGEVSDIFLRANGKLIVRRSRRDLVNFEIVQLYADGSVDPMFIFGADPSSTSFAWWCEQPDERILIVEGFTVRRLNPDGSVDSKFAPDVHLPCFDFEPNDRRLLLTKSGKILFTGPFDEVDGFPMRGFVRLLGSEPHPDFRVHSSSIRTMGAAARIRIVRTGETMPPASVEFATVDGPAKAGSEYIAQSGKLNFAPLEASKEVTISLLSKAELLSFGLRLSNPSPGYSSPGLIPIRVRVFPELRIASESLRRDGAITVRGTLPGAYYFLESSANLRNWLSTDPKIATGDSLQFQPLFRIDPIEFHRVRMVE